jgi:hypothetical protein
MANSTVKIKQVKEEENMTGKKSSNYKRKRKGKRKNDSSDEDDERDRYPNETERSEEKEEEDLVDILREQKGVRFGKEGEIVRKFNWIEEIKNVWRLIRTSNKGMAKCKNAARKYVNSLRDKYTFNCSSITEDPKDPRIIVKRSREPLIEKLCRNGNIPHPFIVQCIKQGC